MLNSLSIIGHVGRAETKDVNGKKVCNFSVAVNDKDVATWFDCGAWGKTAEICEKYLTKGKLVYVEGKLQVKDYTTKEGAKSKRVSIMVNQVTFLSKNENEKEEESTKESSFDDIPF